MRTSATGVQQKKKNQQVNKCVTIDSNRTVFRFTFENVPEWEREI